MEKEVYCVWQVVRTPTIISNNPVYKTGIIFLSSYTIVVKNIKYKFYMPVSVAARSKALVCDRSPAEIVGSNPTGGMDVCLLWLSCVVR